MAKNQTKSQKVKNNEQTDRLIEWKPNPIIKSEEQEKTIPYLENQTQLQKSEEQRNTIPYWENQTQ